MRPAASVGRAYVSCCLPRQPAVRAPLLARADRGGCSGLLEHCGLRAERGQRGEASSKAAQEEKVKKVERTGNWVGLRTTRALTLPLAGGRRQGLLQSPLADRCQSRPPLAGFLRAALALRVCLWLVGGLPYWPRRFLTRGVLPVLAATLAYVARHCAFGEGGVCVDLTQSCLAWARSGECDNNPQVRAAPRRRDGQVPD